MADPGTLIGTGRAADVFDRGDGTVLRRYRTDHDTAAEARVMTWLADQGFPVPSVHEANGPSIVMDLVDGLTMMEDFAVRPWMLFGHARTLATLQRRLNDLVAPPWFPRRTGVPEGGAVLHLDLHPMNVMLAAGGPVVIDWTNAAAGPPSFDAAISYVLMSTFEMDGVVDRASRRVLVETFAAFRGRKALRSALADAAAYRQRDPNVTDAERAALDRFD